jgi:exopolysaccharide biosynthesis polyprenyl glycosylphosphotransferase
MHLSDTTVVLGAVLTFLFVASARSLYGGWLRSCRARGLYARPTVIVGTNDEAIQIAGHLTAHPELGYEVKGYIGPATGTIPTLGDVPDAVQLAASVGATDAVVVSTALTFCEQQQLIRTLLCDGVHVLLSAGLCGIDARRVRPVPTAHEPLLYIKRNRRPLRDFAKRTIDIVLGVPLLIIAIPIFFVTAIAIKCEDRGPVLFKQRRIGRRGNPFVVFKFRSMVPDAEQRLAEVLDLNERDGGPLFKAEHDPRVTRVGRILRATSIDELAQLINVIRGDMSLVGPRPALPTEVEQFDDELRTARNSVRPGMTGLWQVEARDSPSFDSYRYLDLFYSENRTLSLDLAILAGTAKTLFTRTWRLLARTSGSDEEPQIETPHLQLHVSDLGD